MTTTERTTGTTSVDNEAPPPRTVWYVVAIVLVAALAVVFAALWLIERDDVSTMQTDLEATTESLAVAEAESAAMDAEITGLEAELAALTPETTVSHELHAQTRALYEDFLVAIRDPNAEEISAMFSAAASHTSATGQTTTGAEEIGIQFEEYGPMIVTDPGALIVGGDAFPVAAMTGKVGGISGLLVTKVGPAPGGGDGLVFYDMVWYAG